MAIIKCKMCGGDIELSADKTYGTCDSCGSTMTFPKVSDEQRANLFNRANHFRRQNEFDKAVSAYERILDQDDTDAEAHWGVVLSRFGIEYVEDPATHERIPTCHRVQATSILTDADYLAALEHAPDGYSRSLYEAEAKRIAEIQKGILAISAQEKPYDVFICYKESTDGGSRTKDSTLAQDIYYQLTQEGYKVFFSRITLEEKLGQQYEPYIFAALNSAKVMLVVGTKPEYFNAVWVKNEWSRYLALMKQDRSRLLIPCYRDMDAYDLPDELSALQSQDMSKIGFVQDLIRGVKKVLGGDAEQKVQQEATNAPGVASLIKRARLFLEDADFASADEYAEKVLDIDPECAEAYLVKLLVTRQLTNESELETSRQSLEHDSNYAKALRFAKDEQKTAYSAFEQTIQQNIAADRLEADYQHAMALYQNASDEQGYLKAAEAFAALGDYQDAGQMIVSSKEKAQQKYQEHEEMLRKAQARAEQERIRKKQEEEERAAKQAQQELERKHAEEQKQLKRAEQRKKNKKLAAILAAVFAVVLAIGLTVKLYVLPKQTYDNATALLSAGQHDDAIAAFASLDGWGDSDERLKESHYAKAQQQLSQGDLDAAAATFALAGDYSDAADQIGTIEAYQAACLLLEEEKTTEARKAFAALPGFQNADALYAQCCQTDYETATSLMAELDVAAAHAMYVDLGDYSDAGALAAKIEQDYAAAGELLVAGQYTEAADAYALLGNYGESAEQKHTALYQNAEALLAAGQHDDSAAQFEAIGETERAKEVRYAKAEGLYAACQYDEAAAQFAAINESQKANEVSYAKAEALLQAGDETGAEAVWESLGSYSDTADRLHMLRLQIADEAFAAKDYALALEYYQKLIQTDDVKAKEYALAQTAYDAGAYEQAVLAYEALGQYELSVSRLLVARYAWAEQLYTAGDYDAAAEQFTILDDFTDSSARASDASYQHGKQLLEAAAYDDAKTVFTALGTYEDAADLCKECDYQKAAGLMADGSYEDAAALFKTLGQYSDSAGQKLECEYLLAGEAFDAADYTTAEQLFSSLGEYKDAADQTKLSMYNQAGVYFAAADYENAQTIYSTLGEYEDSQTMVNECRLQKALLHQQNGEYEKAVAELEGVEHGTSTQVLAECCLVLGNQLLAQGKVDESVPYYAKAVSLPEAQEKLYQIGRDYAATNQVEKAIETLYLAGQHEDANKLLLEIAKTLAQNEDFIRSTIAYLAVEHADVELTEILPKEFARSLGLFALHEDGNVFRHPIMYRFANKLYLAGQYSKAKEVFSQILNYSDSKAQMDICETAILDGKYNEAMALMEAGEYKNAKDAFKSISPHKDSAEYYRECYSLYLDECFANGRGAQLLFEHRSTGRSGLTFKETLYLNKQYNNVLAAGFGHTVGLRTDGTVVAAGDNSKGQCNVSKWTDIIAIAAGGSHTVGLRTDGTVVAVGNNSNGQCNVRKWTDIVAIAAGSSHTVGLREDGTVVATGWNPYGQCDVSKWTRVVAIGAGAYNTIGLKSNGGVVAVGDIERYGANKLEHWSDIVAVTAGDYSYMLGLKSDGTVVATDSNGYTSDDECQVQGWTNIVAIAAGDAFSLGLKADGTVVAAAEYTSHTACGEYSEVVAVAVGGNSYSRSDFVVCQKADGTVMATGGNNWGQCDVSHWTNIGPNITYLKQLLID